MRGTANVFPSLAVQRVKHCRQETVPSNLTGIFLKGIQLSGCSFAFENIFAKRPVMYRKHADILKIRVLCFPKLVHFTE